MTKVPISSRTVTVQTISMDGGRKRDWPEPGGPGIVSTRPIYFQSNESVHQARRYKSREHVLKTGKESLPDIKPEKGEQDSRVAERMAYSWTAERQNGRRSHEYSVYLERRV